MKTLDDAFNQFITELETYIKLSASFKQALRDIVYLVQYKKGTKIQRFEQIPDQLWFLVKGFAKEATIIETSLDEWVTWFWYANDFLFTEPGLFSLSAADSQIELISDVSLIHISYSNCVKQWEAFPIEASKLMKLIRAKASRNRKRHQIMISSTKLQGRFDELGSLHHDLIVAAKRKDVLEFLGSTDDSFRSFNI